MTNHGIGWLIFLAALGMMCGLVGNDLVNAKSWDEIKSFVFIGKILIHFSTVILAFIGGKLIPTKIE